MNIFKKGLQFNNITRGYYLNGKVAFYKDNFIYDENVINESLNYIDEIAKKLGKTEFKIYFGLLLEENFALDFYYGKYLNGRIIEANENENNNIFEE